MAGTPGYRIIYDPTLPFKAFMGTTFDNGRYLIACGRVSNGADRFKIDLMNGKTGNIAFHFNPRFNQGAIVRNTCIQNSWGTEELELESMPFGPGDNFEVEIRNEGPCFGVYSNGEKIINYNHRLSACEIDTLVIAGDVVMNSVQF
uniref:Galectin n=1 Tax=Dyscophus guineti TaxID=111069 RepID=A0AAU7BBE0_9NEOB